MPPWGISSMPSHDLIPNYAPPAGGLAKLMARIDLGKARRPGTARRSSLYGGLMVGGLAAALAVILLPHRSPTLSELVRRSDALHLYKYGLKAMPTEGVSLQGTQSGLSLRQTAYGYRLDHQ